MGKDFWTDALGALSLFVILIVSLHFAAAVGG